MLDVPYGPGAAERLDIFPAPGGRAPVQVFLHGGAWRRLSKAAAAYPARVLVPAGVCFVAAGFNLATEAPLDEVVRQVRAAFAWVHGNIAAYGGDPGRIFACGHSSGAHLAAMVLAGDWRAAAGLPEPLLKGAVLASGAYDLEPVRLSARNDYLRLDPAGARRNSPALHLPRRGPPVVVAWGAGELDEFRRQGRDFAAACRRRGLAVTALEVAGANHFDMAGALADPHGPVLPAALAQMGLG